MMFLMSKVCLCVGGGERDKKECEKEQERVGEGKIKGYVWFAHFLYFISFFPFYFLFLFFCVCGDGGGGGGNLVMRIQHILYQ